jgi:hypothetical protein
MVTISPRRIFYFVGSCFLFLILLFTSDGCSKDGSSSTSSDPPAPHSAYPSVAKDWTGYCLPSSGLNRQTLTATFAQVADSILNGTCTYHINVDKDVTVTYHGKITTEGQVSFASPPSYFWTIENITATLSTGGDTISGRWWMADGGWVSWPHRACQEVAP